MQLGAVTYNVLKDWDLETVIKNLEAAGYAAVGLPAPNFGVMDRKSALASIAAFEAKLGRSASTAATQLRPVLTDGLRAFGSRYILLNWI